ncbi:MAG: ATP-grasp domain-containing protein [Planctomycetes bacterium]|nr:ATP-grasp domain-containing protein [Planctomycetota bacterium]
MLRKIKRILISNRGEIACRIINTCKALGIQTIVPYLQIEENETFVKNADISVTVSNDNGLNPYLDIKKLLKIARESKADAVHPGYGFLSENPEFSKACSQSGLIFVGPDYKSMSSLSSKTSTKELCKKLNIPVIEAVTGKLTKNMIKKFYSKVKGPILIKAAAGGGGRGMRIVRNLNNIENEIKECQNESNRYFKDPTVFIEKYIQNARHIEVQIVGDKFNNYYHLFERECSIQRRNQKLIEEAPADSIPNHIKQKLYDYALKLVKEVNYTNVGTVEFLVDQYDALYLQEVNTRLQVEHPVTELITGIDLVALQIEIAEGYQIKQRFNDLSYRGHAIECRLVTEDPYNNFIPSTGIIDRVKFPHSQFVRVDTYVKNGTVISPLFDSLIAKIISHGLTRSIAINRLSNYLNELVLTGVSTTASLYLQILKDPDYKNNKIDTNYIGRKNFMLPSEILTASLLVLGGLQYSENNKRYLSSRNLNEISMWKRAIRLTNENTI